MVEEMNPKEADLDDLDQIERTKFLLHGGRLKLQDERNDAYFRELTKGLVDDDKVLFIGFARRDEADRAEVYGRERKQMLAQTDKAIEVVNATYEDLIEQVKAAKAIQITGGESPELVNDMLQYPDFIASLRGKIVGGSSAGACLFSKYYFFNKELGVLEGLGVLPIRLLAHFGNPEFDATEDSLELLKTYPDDLELVVLEECAWIVKEVEL
jgi:peptidase E